MTILRGGRVRGGASLPAIATIPLLDVLPGMALLGKVVMDVCVWLLAVMLVISLSTTRSRSGSTCRTTKMTKQQIKEELRSMENDPETEGVGGCAGASDRPAADQPDGAEGGRGGDRPDALLGAAAVRREEDGHARRWWPAARLHGVPIREVASAHRGADHREAAAGALAPMCRWGGGRCRREFYEAVAEVLAYVYRVEEPQGG